MKKFFALVLAILMLVSTLVSCDQGFMDEPYGGGAQNDDGDGDEGGYTAEIPTTQNPTDDDYESASDTQISTDDHDVTESNTDHVCSDYSYDGDHDCDYCGSSYVTRCNDLDNSHYCDDCFKFMTSCSDSSNDDNHDCDICGRTIDACVDENKDHYCDSCLSKIECYDSSSDKNHNCDICGKEMDWEYCSDSSADNNHSCDICGKFGITQCSDSINDGDHKCDTCGKKGITQCQDKEGDTDHYCDECTEPCSDHSDREDDTDHNCDECGKEGINSCYDSSDDTDHDCDVCGEALGDCADLNSDGKCDECGASMGTGGNVATETYTRNGNKITFGSYPQTKVTDEALASALTSKAGTLPTGNDSQAWTSYGYYVSGSVGNFMWYIDVEQDGEKYRGVYFTSYRPYIMTYISSADYSSQDDNGYSTSTVYWFKYEPISWTVLSENTTDGTALILCDMIIDSQQYDYENGTYKNNYAESTIRKWLNENFYNTAFNELQKQIIFTTTVDNSVESTGYSSNSYACENTQDKVFLLSYQDVINANYGFLSNYSDYDTARQKKPTDYAQAQGAWTSTITDYAGNGYWWLRSPEYNNSNRARVVSVFGHISYGNVNEADGGVVPALQIRL